MHNSAQKEKKEKLLTLFINIVFSMYGISSKEENRHKEVQSTSIFKRLH
jgi:hypothetical protein